MSFPQPDSVQPVLNGQQSFRLKTLLSSAGDMYESEVSALAFAIGPDSDLANVEITYFDPNAPGSVSRANISPDRSLVGRIDARNEARYPIGRPGRILISPQDGYNSAWRPSGFNGANDAIAFVQPTLDVIQYFVNPPSLIPQRSDKTFTFQYLTVAPSGTGDTYLVIPAYGRKSGYFTFNNIGNGIASVRVTVLGLRYGESASPGPDAAVTGTVMAATDLITASSTSAVFKASTMGLWDALVIKLGGGGLSYPGGAFPINVTLSDDPQ